MDDYIIDDIVILKYNGNKDVPLYLADTKAKVVGFTKLKVKVQPFNMDDGHIINVRPHQLAKTDK